MRVEAKGLTKQFPGVLALRELSLTFEPGKVHGLVGENGAGKSTLMHLLSGGYRPTGGHLEIDGEKVALSGIADAMARGIVLIHQELNLVSTLTVADNVFLGREPRRGPMVDYVLMCQKTSEYLSAVGATFSPTRMVGTLTLAEQQLVEIAKALSMDAKLILMDEPTAVLSGPEVENLFALIRRLREKGRGIVYISHRLAELKQICDTISVMRDGEWVATLDQSEFQTADLPALMVGRPLQSMFPPRREGVTAEPILKVKNLSAAPRVKDVSFEVRPGEIVGLAGLVGAGRTETAMAIIGEISSSGELWLNGKPFSPKSIRDSAERGICYLSEDRKGTGLLVILDVLRNLTLPNLASYGKFWTRPKIEADAGEKWKEQMNIRVGGLDTTLQNLSGGNQQKVALAKWLELRPSLLILDEPTRGVDVGAKAEIYAIVDELVRDGMACLVISSELPELAGLCDRVVVVNEGEAAGELVGEQISEESMMRLAAHGERAR